jgi:hypothetical protein
MLRPPGRDGRGDRGQQGDATRHLDEGRQVGPELGRHAGTAEEYGQVEGRADQALLCGMIAGCCNSWVSSSTARTR